MITTNELAERLGIRPDYIHELIRSRAIPRGKRLNRSLYWTEEQCQTVAEIIAKRRKWRSTVQTKRDAGKLRFIHPVVRQLVDHILDHSDFRTIAELAGYEVSGLRSMYRGGDMRFLTIADVAQACGFELILREKQ